MRCLAYLGLAEPCLAYEACSKFGSWRGDRAGLIFTSFGLCRTASGEVLSKKMAGLKGG